MSKNGPCSLYTRASYHRENTVYLLGLRQIVYISVLFHYQCIIYNTHMHFLKTNFITKHCRYTKKFEDSGTSIFFYKRTGPILMLTVPSPFYFWPKQNSPLFLAFDMSFEKCNFRPYKVNT
jgi:hypothetical protein